MGSEMCIRDSFYIKWFRKKGFHVFTPPDNIPFEGGGDIVTTRYAYLLGWGKRSDIGAKEFLERSLNLEKPILPLRLVDDRFFHLDLCVFYLPLIDTIFYFPGAFDRDSLKAIKKLRSRKIEVSKRDALRFALNSVYLNKTVIMGGKSKRMEDIFQKKGFSIERVDVSEFKKGGVTSSWRRNIVI